MKIINKITAVLLATLALSMTANAHDPKSHVTKAIKADCSNIEDKNMAMDDPLMKVMMKKCLQHIDHSNKQMSPVEKTVHLFHSALKKGKQKQARELLDDNVTIFEGGRVERTAAEYANHHMLADMKYLAAINTETLEQNIKVIGNIAYVMSRSKSTGHYKNKVINHESMETMILQKTNGNWKISHIHWSN